MPKSYTVRSLTVDRADVLANRRRPDDDNGDSDLSVTKQIGWEGAMSRKLRRCYLDPQG